VNITSFVYGTKRSDTTLHLQIKKENEDFIHLSMHMAPEWLSTGEKDNGIVHIYKDVYEKYVSKRKAYTLYAIYSLSHPPNKPNSLIFSITQGYSTSLYPSAPSSFQSAIVKYDDDVKREMDIITIVLNKLFDEDNIDYYIGDYHKKYPININNPVKLQQLSEINNTINNVLNNINKRSQYVKRRNIGVLMIRTHNNKSKLTLYRNKHTRKQHKNSRSTRKKLK